MSHARPSAGEAERSSASPKQYSDMEVYHCTFDIYLQEATMVIKFPCSYLVELKSINGKLLIAATKNKVPAIDSVAKFNETLKFETELLFNKQVGEFQKKEVLLLLNLISNRRPEQMKLVGRIPIDLGQIANTEHYSTLRGYKLEYCSVDAHVIFKGKFMGKKLSTTPPERFDRDSFSDYQSFIAGIHNSRDYGHGKPYSKGLAEDPEKSAEISWKNRPSPSAPQESISQRFGSLVIQQDQLGQKESRVAIGRASHKVVDRPSPQDSGRSKDVYQSNGVNQKSYREQSPVIPTLRIGSMESERQIDEIKQQFVNPPPIMTSQTKQSRARPNPNSSLLKQTSDHSLNKKSFQQESSQYVNQTTHQNYEEILRNSHAQERRIWEEQKKIFNDQIARQKLENQKLKDRIQQMEKKAHEYQSKIVAAEGKIENSKRQMSLFEREKNLEISQFKAKAERALKQRNEISDQLLKKQEDMRDMNLTIRSLEGTIRAAEKEHYEKLTKMTEALNSANRNISELQRIVSSLRSEAASSHNNSQEDRHNITKKTQSLEEKNISLQNKLKQIQNDFNQRLKEGKQRQQALQYNLEQSNLNLKLETALNLEKIKNMEEKIAFKDQQINKFEKQIQKREQQRQHLKAVEDTLRAEIKSILDKQTSSIESSKKDSSTTNTQFDELLRTLSQRERTIKQLEDKLQLKKVQQTNNKSSAIQQQELSEKIQQMNQRLKQKDEMIDKLKSKGQILEESNQSYKKDINQRDGKINQLESDLRQKTTDLRQSQISIGKMKETIDDMKRYEKGLQEQLLKLDDNGADKKFMNIIQAERNRYLQSQQKLEKRLQALEAQHEQQDSLNANLKDANNQLKSYVTSLEKQVLAVHNKKQEKGNTQNEELQEAKLTIERLKEQIQEDKNYKNSLEEQILKNYEQKNQTESALEDQRQKYQMDLFNQKEYITNLQQQIIQYHEQISDLEKSIKRSEEVQKASQGQIVEMHIKLQDMKQKLRNSQEIVPELQKRQSDTLLIEQLKDQISGLNNQLQQLSKKSRSESQIMVPADEDYLILQDKINEKDEYIERLENNLAQRQDAIHKIQQHNRLLKKQLTKILKQNQENLKNKKQKQQLVNEQEDVQEDIHMYDLPDSGSYEPMIRIVRVNSESQSQNQSQRASNGQDRILNNEGEECTSEQDFVCEIIINSVHGSDSGCGTDRNDLEKPPQIQFSAQEDEEMMDSLKYQSNPSINPLQEEIKKLKQKLEEKEVEINRLKVIEQSYVNRQDENENISESDIRVSKQFMANLEDERNYLISRTEKLEEQVEKLILQKEALMDSSISLQKKQPNEESSQFIQTIDQLTRNMRDLEETCEHYQQKIKFLKDKESQMEKTLAIIEEESQKIIAELDSKQDQLYELREIISERERTIQSLNSKLRASAGNQGKNSPNMENTIRDIQNEYTAKIRNLQKQLRSSVEKCSRLQQVSISQSNQLEKLRNLLDQQLKKSKKNYTIPTISETRNDQQKYAILQERANQLQKDLNDANQQLLVNKKMLTRIRSKESFKKEDSKISQCAAVNNSVDEQSRREQSSRAIDNVQDLQNKIEELQISLFSHQANENQKDILIADLRQEVLNFKNLVKGKQNKIMDLLDEIDRLKQGIESPVLMVQSLTKSDSMPASEEATLKTSLKIQEAEIINLQTNISFKAHTIEKLQQKINNLQDQIDEQRIEFNHQSQLYQDHIAELKKQLAQKTSEILALKEEVHMVRTAANQGIEEDIRQLNLQVEEKGNQMRRLQQEKENLQTLCNQKEEEIFKLQAEIAEVRSELEICQQQNQFQMSQPKNSSIRDIQNPMTPSFDENAKKVEELTLQLRENNLLYARLQQQLNEKQRQLQQYIKNLRQQNQNLASELEQRQMEHLSTQLDFHIKLKEKSDRSNISNQGQLRRSTNSITHSQEIPVNDLKPACKILKELISERNEKQPHTQRLQNVLSHITKVQEILANSAIISKEKTLILQKTRLLSMYLSKLKSFVFKNYPKAQDRTKIFEQMKPMDTVIKEILNLAEILSQSVILDSDELREGQVVPK